MNAPLGKNTIAEMMKKISIKCSLSKMYTNHCLWATSIMFSNARDIQAKDICSVSRHKSSDGIPPYTSGTAALPAQATPFL